MHSAISSSKSIINKIKFKERVTKSKGNINVIILSNPKIKFGEFL